MIQTPWLIQRLKIKVRPNKETKLRLSEVISSDYMGSSEFEFGAIPKAYRRVCTNLDSYTITVIEGVEENKLYLFSSLSEEDIVKYKEFLVKAVKDDVRLQENPYFIKEYRELFKIDLWWDLDNDLFFSFDTKFMKRISAYLNNSKQYIANLPE